MAPHEGLPGIDSSLEFSAERLDHLFLVFHGAGDPYIDHQPWLSSLEKCLTRLQTNYNVLLSDIERLSGRNAPASSTTNLASALFLPVEYHRTALETWQSQVRKGDPRVNTTGTTTIREAVSDSVSPIIMMASPFWKRNLAIHVSDQIRAQLDAVRRNRPAFSGRVSILTHSIGCIVALELLRQHHLLPDDIQLDAVVMTGCPLPAYAALAPDDQMALATIRSLRPSIRFINIFHPLDPVAYRLEPFLLGDNDELFPAVKVSPRRRTFWQDAELFWDDVVYNLWSSLFPRRSHDDEETPEQGYEQFNEQTAGGQPQDQVPPDEEEIQGDGEEDREVVSNLFSSFGGNTRGKPRVQNTAERNRRKQAMRRSTSYVLPESAVDGDKDVGGDAGGEVLLSGRIDYELQDGMGMPPIDLMASWGAIKAHSYYWQSLDVAQMLLDVAMTSETAMSSRN